ncbi:hypothetical protein ABZ297_35225 [Nonomuraea sp. NPDC005983]|uniref:hypothetical protein n=1 Tax=Nonomuraea sp. NPDC005983 TaxID=3155595 RepID=UPI0033B4442C
MVGRMGRAAGVYGALGVLWWASVRLTWLGIGCEDWGCLAPAVGALAVVTVTVLGAAAVALERVGVRPGRRVAVVAAGVLTVFRLVGEVLPSWPSAYAHAVAAAAAFAGAGAIAAFVTAAEVPKSRRVLAGVAVVALLPAAAVVVAWTAEW